MAPTRFEIRNLIFEVLSEHRDDIKVTLGEQYTGFVTTPGLLALAKVTADVLVDVDEMARTIRETLAVCRQYPLVWDLLNERAIGLDGLLDETRDFDDALAEVKFVEEMPEEEVERELETRAVAIEAELKLEQEEEAPEETVEPEGVPEPEEIAEYEPEITAAVIGAEPELEREQEIGEEEVVEEPEFEPEVAETAAEVKIPEIPEVYITVSSRVRSLEEDEKSKAADVPAVDDASALLRIRHAILDTVQGQRATLEARMGADYKRLVMSAGLLELARLGESVDTPMLTKGVMNSLTACKAYPQVWRILERRIVGVEQLLDEGFTFDAAVQNVIVLDELPPEEPAKVRAWDESAGMMAEPAEVKRLQRRAFRRWAPPEQAVSAVPRTQMRTTRGLDDAEVRESYAAPVGYTPDLIAMRPSLSTATAPPVEEAAPAAEVPAIQRQSAAVLRTILDNKETIRARLGDAEFRSFLVKAEIQTLVGLLDQVPVDQNAVERTTSVTLNVCRQYPMVWNTLVRNVPGVAGLLKEGEVAREISEQRVTRAAPTPSYVPAPIPAAEPVAEAVPAITPSAPIVPTPAEQPQPVEKVKVAAEEKEERMAEQPQRALSVWERLTDREFVTSFLGVIVVVSTTLVALVTLIVAIVSLFKADTREALQGAKDVLLLMNGMAGVVLGYYFGRAPGEARAESAEKLSQQYQQQTEAATTKSNQMTQVLNSMVSEVENLFAVSGASATRAMAEDPQVRRQKAKLEGLMAQAKKYTE